MNTRRITRLPAACLAPAWSFITGNTDIEYRDVARPISARVASRMRRSGQL